MLLYLVGCVTRNNSTQVNVLCVNVWFFFIFFFGSLRAISLSACGNCEHLSTSTASQQHPVGLPLNPGMRGLNSTPTPPSRPTSSLGLLKLLQERGISASPSPHPRYTHLTPPSDFTAKEESGVSSLKEDGSRNIFSFNLVEKLQSLGLHKVVTRGMVGLNWEERETVGHPPKVWYGLIQHFLLFPLTLVTLHEAMWLAIRSPCFLYLFNLTFLGGGPVVMLSWKWSLWKMYLEPYFGVSVVSVIVYSTLLLYELVCSR